MTPNPTYSTDLPPLEYVPGFLGKHREPQLAPQAWDAQALEEILGAAEFDPKTFVPGGKQVPELKQAVIGVDESGLQLGLELSFPYHGTNTLHDVVSVLRELANRIERT